MFKIVLKGVWPTLNGFLRTITFHPSHTPAIFCCSNCNQLSSFPAIWVTQTIPFLATYVTQMIVYLYIRNNSSYCIDVFTSLIYLFKRIMSTTFFSFLFFFHFSIMLLSILQISSLSKTGDSLFPYWNSLPFE